MKIKFLDSYLFISYPLAKFPKLFGFPESESKGYFPYSYLTLSTLDYVGDIPDRSFFPTEKYDDMADFEKWYSEVKPGGYDIQNEIKKYCMMDVNLLCRGWSQFRHMFLTLCSTDPNDRLTLSSTCNAFFRNHCMPPETMCLLPNNERLVPNNIQSVLATKYLHYLEKELGVVFQMAGRGGGEAKILTYKLDAYLPETREAWDVLGCYFHGCLTCFKRTTIVAGGRTAESVYLESRLRRKNILKTGIKYTEVWEHQIRDKMKNDLDMRRKMESFDIDTPINVRHALFGGRCEVFRLYYDANEDCQGGLLYADINSLYPTVMRVNLYPTGDPIHLSRDLNRFLAEINKNKIPWKGLLKVKVIAKKRDLLIPVLPRRDEKSGKCLFVLCRTCPSDPPKNGICQHTFEERAFTGVWTHCELSLAIKNGYQVLSVSEVWAWPENAWRDDLFKTYLDLFIALKVQASGWPKPNMTEKEKDLYLQEYLNHEGIHLDKNKMIFNPGLRIFCKLCLNNLWGFLCQR